MIESKVVTYLDAIRPEQWAVVRFLIAEGERNPDINRRMRAVYDEHCLGRTAVNNWCKSFCEGKRYRICQACAKQNIVITNDCIAAID